MFMSSLAQVIRRLKHIVGNFLRLVYHSYLRSAGVEIGANTMISLGAKIDIRRGKVVIGNNCTITHGCAILSHDAAAARMGKPSSQAVTVIEDDVFIGVNSVVLSGVRIGRGSIIGAGSVVVFDIPPGAVAVGNPARVMKFLEEGQARTGTEADIA
jgi:acetyltransferase-like isoleucine patch superfamily enzyme